MNTTALDTLDIAERLQKKGMEPELAKEHAKIWRETTELHLVTKEDLRHEILKLKIYNGSLAGGIIAILAAIKYFG